MGKEPNLMDFGIEPKNLLRKKLVRLLIKGNILKLYILSKPYWYEIFMKKWLRDAHLTHLCQAMNGFVYNSLLLVSYLTLNYDTQAI